MIWKVLPLVISDPRLVTGDDLLAAPPNHERVATLQPHDDPPAKRLVDQDRIDLVLMSCCTRSLQPCREPLNLWVLPIVYKL